MRTLKMNYSTNLTWKRSPAADVAARVQQILNAEKLSVPLNAVSRVVEMCRGDIRQVLNFFQMTKTEDCNSLNYDEAKARYVASPGFVSEGRGTFVF